MTSLQRVIKYCALAFAILLIVTIIGGICAAAGIVFGLLDGDGDVAGEMKTYEIQSQIQDLDLDVGAAELKIVSGDRFLVESNHKYLTVQQKRGTLQISEDIPFFHFFYSAKGVTVTLTVPEGFVFGQADIDTGAGRVDISALRADDLELDLGAGEAVIDTLDVLKQGSISTGAGRLVIKGGQMHNLSLDHGVGKLELTGLLTGRCDVDLGVGDTDLTLLGTLDDYEIRLDKGVGDATLDGRPMGDGGVYGLGQNRIDIDGGVGSFSIQFRES